MGVGLFIIVVIWRQNAQRVDSLGIHGVKTLNGKEMGIVKFWVYVVLFGVVVEPLLDCG